MLGLRCFFLILSFWGLNLMGAENSKDLGFVIKTTEGTWKASLLR